MYFPSVIHQWHQLACSEPLLKFNSLYFKGPCFEFGCKFLCCPNEEVFIRFLGPAIKWQVCLFSCLNDLIFSEGGKKKKRVSSLPSFLKHPAAPGNLKRKGEKLHLPNFGAESQSIHFLPSLPSGKSRSLCSSVVEDRANMTQKKQNKGYPDPANVILLACPLACSLLQCLFAPS